MYGCLIMRHRFALAVSLFLIPERYRLQVRAVRFGLHLGITPLAAAETTGELANWCPESVWADLEPGLQSSLEDFCAANPPLKQLWEPGEQPNS